MDELFAPPAYDWVRLSPRYPAMRRLTSVVVPVVVTTVPAVLIGVLFSTWAVSVILWSIGAAAVVGRLSIVGRNWRSWGYVERDDDLFISHGVLRRTLIAVPYGRMQLVEVTSGPLQRAFGLATVILKTASPRSSAHIPGLLPTEAARLRDRLTALGESQSIPL